MKVSSGELREHLPGRVTVIWRIGSGVGSSCQRRQGPEYADLILTHPSCQPFSSLLRPDFIAILLWIVMVDFNSINWIQCRILTSADVNLILAHPSIMSSLQSFLIPTFKPVLLWMLIVSIINSLLMSEQLVVWWLVGIGSNHGMTFHSTQNLNEACQGSF